MNRGYSMNCYVVLAALVVASLTISRAVSQSPGDEDNECLTSTDRPSTVNQNILMATFNYANLLENDGGPWAVVDEDENNDSMDGNSIPTVR